MKNFVKTNKGITLIALVITIIVLLILAGISIATLAGENGILAQASKAKEAQIIGNEKETLEIAAEAATIKSKAEDIEVNEWSQEFIKELKEIVGEEKCDIVDNNYEEIISVEFKDTGNIYIVHYDGRTNTYLGILTEEEMLEKVYGEYINNITDEAEKQELDNNYLNKGIQIKVTSGKTATLIIGGGSDLIIDWGDGTYSRLNELATSNNVRIASSKNNFKIALNQVYNYYHKYSEKEKEYTVRIYSDTNIFLDYDEQILEITDWGQTNIERIELAGCEKLEKIATPRDNSFQNLWKINFEGCTSLTSIPEGLFKNCPNLSDFTDTFNGCTRLTNIPTGLFDNCTNVEYFYRTFYGCTGLTGEVPELWKKGTNSESNQYRGKPSGKGCFANCTNVSNYSSIPDYWKQE